MENKRVLVISTSQRMNSNSDILSDEFIKGAIKSGNKVDKVSLFDKEIKFCKGCLGCQKTGRCPINDDVQKIINQMKQADIIVFATPVYFYNMSGQMKTLLDRSNPLFNTDYNFKDIYLIASAADDEKDTFDGTIQSLQGWIRCFENCSLKGVIKGSQMSDMGDAREKDDIIKEAYLLGRSI